LILAGNGGQQLARNWQIISTTGIRKIWRCS